MNPRGYIFSGIGSAFAAFVVLSIAHSDDELERSIARAQVTLGQTPDPSSDTLANWIGLLLILAAVALILVGVIGAGIRAGQRQSESSRRDNLVHRQP